MLTDNLHLGNTRNRTCLLAKRRNIGLCWIILTHLKWNKVRFSKVPITLNVPLTVWPATTNSKLARSGMFWLHHIDFTSQLLCNHCWHSMQHQHQHYCEWSEWVCCWSCRKYCFHEYRDRRNTLVCLYVANNSDKSGSHRLIALLALFVGTFWVLHSASDTSKLILIRLTCLSCISIY